MSSGYLQIETPSGEIQINDSTKLLALKEKTTLSQYYAYTVNAYYSINGYADGANRNIYCYVIPASSTLHFVFNPTTSQAYVWTNIFQQTSYYYKANYGTKKFIAISDVDKDVADSFVLYEYDYYDGSAGEEYGLEVFGSSGARIFSSSAKILKLLDVNYQQVSPFDWGGDGDGILCSGYNGNGFSYSGRSYGDGSKQIAYWRSIAFRAGSTSSSVNINSKRDVAVMTNTSLVTAICYPRWVSNTKDDVYNNWAASYGTVPSCYQMDMVADVTNV